MNRLIVILCVLMGLGMILISYPDGALSVLLVLVVALPAIFITKHYAIENEKNLIINVFLVALLCRLFLGVVIHFFELERMFGPDAFLYHERGERLMEIWLGLPVPNDYTTYHVTHLSAGPGWGMNYLVASIYLIFGPSMLVAQSFCGAIGALTALMVYFCSKRIFNNLRVSKISALAVALFPSFIIWSSQLLKDGLLIFLLICVMTIVLQLQKKLSYPLIIILILALYGIYSLRFYIFYMVLLSVVGSFVIGLSSSIKKMVRNAIVIVLLGLSLTYLGIIRNAGDQFEQYGNLERVQYSRRALATTDSGFGEDIDVSTPAGALAAVPIGFTYLMLAPFPWQAQKTSQILVLPEMFFWWALIPFMIGGLWYTLKNRLIRAMPILVFTFMLTIAYSIFQGNVGMAYRQRTQIQVFLFIFIAVGWSVIQERNENKIISRQIAEEKLRKKLKARQLELEN